MSETTTNHEAPETRQLPLPYGDDAEREGRVVIEGQIVGETEKAIRIKAGNVTEWIPKSQITYETVQAYVTVDMPQWIAEAKGFEW